MHKNTTIRGATDAQKYAETSQKVYATTHIPNAHGTHQSVLTHTRYRMYRLFSLPSGKSRNSWLRHGFRLHKPPWMEVLCTKKSGAGGAKSLNNTGTATRSRQSCVPVRRWLGALVAVAAVGALLLAGCGDDAASGGATTPPADTTAPPAVTGLSAVAVDGSDTDITLSWALPDPIPSDAAKLQLRYATTRAGLAEATPVDIATTRADILTATTYTLTETLTSGTQYHFAVLIVDNSGNALPLSGADFTDSATYVTTGIPGSTRPIVSAVQISTADATTATVTAVVNEAGKLFWVVYVDGTAAPANTAALITDAGIDTTTTTTASIVANSGSEGIPVAAAGMVSISITGLAIGTSYDLYVAATDTDSNNSALPVKLDFSTVPPAVTSLSAVAAGDGSSSIVLSWTLPAAIPSDAAQLQLRYAITRAGLASATPVDIATTRADILTATSYTLTEPLTSGTEYHFSVLIVNSAGNALPLSGAGFTGSVSYVTTGTPDSVVPTVNSVQISTVGTTTATVTTTVSEAGTLFWVAYADGTAAPADAATLITDAGKVTTTPILASSGSAGQVVAAAGMVTVSITDLVIGTSYDLYVAAKDAAGNNSVLSAKLALSTLPPAVTGLSAVAAGGGTTNIALSWTLPAAIPNDAAKLQLRYATTRAGLAGATPVDIATTRADILTTTTYTLTEPLTGGTEYHFSVLIVNSASNSLPLSGADFTGSVSYVTTGTPASTLPGIPTNLRVTALAASSGNVSVTVEWQNPANAANIELSWMPNTPTPGKTDLITATAAGSTQSTTITLTDDTTYTISAVAINSSSARSSAASITNQRVDLAAPAIPTGVSLALATNGSITVSWTASASDDVAGYEVLWATTAAMLPASPVGQQAVLATETSASTGVLAIGATYYFVVIASDGANALGASAIRTSSSAVANIALPGVPTNLSVTALAASSGSVSVTVEWQNPVNAANIELSWTPATPAPGKSDLITATAAGSTQSATITIADDTTYTISAVAISSNDVRSSAVSITGQRIDLAAPAVPTSVSLAPAADGTVTVSWTASASDDVAGYEVLWATAAAMLPADPVGRQTVAASATTSVTTGVLTRGTTYYFVVIARDGANILGAARTSSSATVNAVVPIMIDSNNNTLIDISNLDMLNNIRCNLAGTTYLTADSSGTCATSGALQCGTTGTTACTGYELMRDLDFATATDYASGAINAAWRPTNAAGTVVTDTTTATNAGWAPIGDSSSTHFLSTFDGNNNSISNLYARRSDRVGLFGYAGSNTMLAIVRDLALIDGHVYGNNAADAVGMAVGDMNSRSTSPISSISNVSVRNGSVNGEGGGDNVGGLVGSLTAGIVNNSHSTATVNGGAGADSIGGLVGAALVATINGSYASGAVNGGADNDRVGGLVGFSASASSRVIASHATGAVDGGAGTDDGVGGLVGDSSGSIIASYATGDATVTSSATGEDNVGGLVGHNNTGTIIASYATGNASGGANVDDDVGGLVGGDINGTITASYATGNASGGSGGSDGVGGLIGSITSTTISTITASYATGNASGGAGTDDNTGALVGNSSPFGITITVSYGFGSWFTESEPVERHLASRNPSLPSGITTATGIAGAQKLTAGATPTTTAAGAQWNAATSNTMGAWNFGSATQAPALVYADYDGTAGTTYSCDLFPAKIPGTETAIVCGTTLLPGQPR